MEACELPSLARWYKALRERPNCVVVDVETNGIIVDQHIPRIVQFAWSVLSLTSGSLARRSYVIYPAGFSLDGGGRDRKHSITQDQALREGRPIAEVLSEFDADLLQFDVRACVAHNVEFDAPVISHEFTLNGLNSSRFHALAKLCTMRDTVGIVRLDKASYSRRIQAYRRNHNMGTRRSRVGFEFYKERLERERYKYPTLRELYNHLVVFPRIDWRNVTAEDLLVHFRSYRKDWHEAAADVAVCEECFLILWRQAYEDGRRSEERAKNLEALRLAAEEQRRRDEERISSEKGRRPWWNLW